MLSHLALSWHLPPALFMLCTMPYFWIAALIRSTGILAAAVGMHNGSANLRIPQARSFQCFTAQFGSHMVCHGKTIWHQIIAIKNRRNIQLSVFCLDFSNICNAFFQRCICCKITFQKIIRFTGFTVGFGDSVGLSLGSMNQVYLLHHAADSCFAWYLDAIKLADFFSVL